jgi:hypothetical protein
MKILIGCPTCDRYAYCIDNWIQRVKEIIEFSKEHQIDYLLVDNSETDNFFMHLMQRGINVIKAPHFDELKKTLAYSRNLLREKALKEKYDFFFSLEQDIIPEKNALEKLLSHNEKIVSGYYCYYVGLTVKDKETDEIKNVTIEAPLIYLEENNARRRATPNEILNKGLIKVGSFGFGCVLISIEVLKKIKFRFEDKKASFDDWLFCYDAKKLGYDLFLDSDVRAKHLHLENSMFRLKK